MVIVTKWPERTEKYIAARGSTTSSVSGSTKDFTVEVTVY